MCSCSPGWTLYISLSNSTLLPTYGFEGFEHYVDLWANRRWNIAYTNLFLFSAFYVVFAMAVGLLLALLIDQKMRAESRSGARSSSIPWRSASSSPAPYGSGSTIRRAALSF